MEERQLLQSWKEIAAYLDCSLRTCHRWEESLDLPIHRLDGTPKARVCAYADELDRWRAEKLGHNGRRVRGAAAMLQDHRKRLWILSAAAFLAAGALLVPRFLPSGLLPVPVDKPTLAILPFELAGQDDGLAAWGTAFPDLLITDLDQSRFVTVVGITETYRKLRELKLDGAGGFSAEDLKRFAEAEKVRYLATGRLGRTGHGATVSVAVHDLSSGVAADPCEAGFRDEEGVFEAADDLSVKIKRTLGLDPRHVAHDIDERAADISTGSPQAFLLYSKGLRLAGTGKQQEAIPVVQKAVETAPDFALAHKTLFFSCLRARREEEAREYLRKAVDLSERMSERERGQTRVLFYESYEKDVPRMLESLETLCRFYPDDWFGSSRLMQICTREEDWDRALRLGEQSWRANVANSNTGWSILENLVMACENLGQADRAESLLDEYLEDPSARFSNSARQYRSNLLVRRGRFEAALSDIETLAAERPDDPKRFFNAGTVHLHRDDFASAEREYLKSLEQRDTLARLEALEALSDLNLARGQVEEAIERMRQRLEMIAGWEGTPVAVRAGHEVDCHQRLARLYRVTNRLPEAAREIEAASRIVDSVTSPGRTIRLTVLLETLHLDALIALDMGREDEFEEQAERIKRSVERDGYPRLMRTYYYLLGYRELKRNNLERAVGLLGRAVDLMSVPGRVGLGKDEADPQLLFALAEAYDRLESRSTIRALPAFEKVTQPVFSRLRSRGDLYAKSFYHMARIYENEADFRYATAPEKRENLAKAIANYRKFLGLWEDASPIFAAYVEDARARLAHLTSPVPVPAAGKNGT